MNASLIADISMQSSGCCVVFLNRAIGKASWSRAFLKVGWYVTSAGITGINYHPFDIYLGGYAATFMQRVKRTDRSATITARAGVTGDPLSRGVSVGMDASSMGSWPQAVTLGQPKVLAVLKPSLASCAA